MIRGMKAVFAVLVTSTCLTVSAQGNDEALELLREAVKCSPKAQIESNVAGQAGWSTSDKREYQFSGDANTFSIIENRLFVHTNRGGAYKNVQKTTWKTNWSNIEVKLVPRNDSVIKYYGGNKALVVFQCKRNLNCFREHKEERRSLDRTAWNTIDQRTHERIAGKPDEKSTTATNLFRLGFCDMKTAENVVLASKELISALAK
jgi:hypothetical protein